MKDYKINKLDCHTVDNLIFVKNEPCPKVTLVQGTLINSYFIDDWNRELKFYRGCRVKPRKHLYALETLANELDRFPSVLNLVLTDNDKKYYQLKRDYLTNYLRKNKKDNFLNKYDKNYLETNLLSCIKKLNNC